MRKPSKRIVIYTGLIGMFAAALVGPGEGLLHFDPAANYTDDGTYPYMLDIPRWRLTWGHYLAVLGSAPIALNSGYFIFFALSTLELFKICDDNYGTGDYGKRTGTPQHPME